MLQVLWESMKRRGFISWTFGHYFSMPALRSIAAPLPLEVSGVCDVDKFRFMPLGQMGKFQVRFCKARV